jgi:CubicO group peptidase (beta-lactamase class C family)
VTPQKLGSSSLTRALGVDVLPPQLNLLKKVGTELAAIELLDNEATVRQWDGRQIVSAGWIAESVKPRFQATNMFGGLFYYGYQWWIGRTLVGDREIKWIAGQGLGGQRLTIVPDHELVMMVTQGL